MSRRNRGVYEPEFRLIFMSTMLFGLFGYIGWAGELRLVIVSGLPVTHQSGLPVGNQHKMPWIGAVGCITFVVLGDLRH